MRLLALLVAIASFAGLARAEPLYAVSGSFGQSSTLYTLDKTDGSLLSTVGATGFSHVTGIAFHPGTGVLYGVISDTFGSGLTQLVTIDTVTGAGTVVGTTGHQISDLAFDPTGTLYGLSQGTLIGGVPTGTDDLVTIDLGTGLATIVADATLIMYSTGVGIDSTGTTYVKTSQANGLDVLLSVDRISGIPFDAVSLSQFVHNMLAYDENDVLYSGARLPPQGSGGFTLFTIDPVTGTVTTVGSNALPFISGIAFQPTLPVPEPASLLLVLVGAAGFLVHRRRNRPHPRPGRARRRVR